jgi:hypothetical protein
MVQYPSHIIVSDLVQWLWSTVIQKELNTLIVKFNDHKVRTDRTKLIPSGVAPNVAYSLHNAYGGENCLEAVDRDVIDGLMQELGGEDLIHFVPAAYEAKAIEVFESLNITDLTLQNVWDVFQSMLPLMTSL